MFEGQKNRDAWYVIRGFVYQVDLIILKWILLNPNQILELERGEDVDTITKIGDEEILRKLGQIKHKELDISLNDVAVIDILLNYFLHITVNPDSNLLFNFITNANYKHERPAIFGDGTKGIQAWIHLHNAKEKIEVTDFRFKKIQEHLNAKVKSLIKFGDDLTQQVLLKNKELSSFAQYIEDDQKFLGFVKSFSWSLKNEAAESISDTVKKSLIDTNCAENEKQADAIYARLFLHIFKILGTSHT